jgi:peptidoglycan/xylan/chitin deacetylase (PgdA/CDA1 family)
VPRRAPAHWRWRVKATLASAIVRAQDHWIGAMLARPVGQPLILGYHRVVDDFSAVAQTEMPSMLIGRAMFERHIDVIGRHFRFAGLDEIGARIESGEPFTERVAAVTFDDGYRDVYEQAYPLLVSKGIPAAVFVVTDLVGRTSWQHHDRLYRLVAKAFAAWEQPQRRLLGLLSDLGVPAAERLEGHASADTALGMVSALVPALSHHNVGMVLDGLEAAVGNGFGGAAPRTLTWPMVLDMRRHGFVIGSHSHTHVSLPTESKETVAEELEGSKRTLEQALGEKVAHFAYPGGQFTDAVVEAVDRAGYRFAYTACPHGAARFPQLTIQRLLLWEGSSLDADGRFSEDVLSCQARGLWPPVRMCRVHHV